MKRNSILLLIFLYIFTFSIKGQNHLEKKDKTIFVYGSDINIKFTQYIADLTEKEHPRICYIPTASADNEENIKFWNFICKKIGIESHVLKVWGDSQSMTTTFEETLLSMDAIVVGGGNTLNMLGIWKAQQIDKALKKALERGIILAGGSAGSICWFKNGISDSRPINLSIVKGLNFLPFSHCPHYNQIDRKELFHTKIINGEMKQGYACDDNSGILFRNGKFVESVRANAIAQSYFISKKYEKIESKTLPSRILIKKEAISEEQYSSLDINKKVRDYQDTMSLATPLEAYISFQYAGASGKNSKLKDLTTFNLKEQMPKTDATITEEQKEKILNQHIYKIFTHDNLVAGIVSYSDNWGYIIRYLVKENEEWKNAGEDIGGESIQDAEISFREKALVILKKSI